MKRMFVLLFLVATFAVAANAQCGDRSMLGWMLAGPCAERAAREAYAPVDRIIGAIGPGGYFDYGPYGNGRGTLVSAATGAIAGAITGGLVARAASRRHDDREYMPSPDGGRAYYASGPQGREVRWLEPKPAKPLNCRKPAGKRGNNEAACAAAEEQEARREAEARAEAERQTLAASPWRLYNRSGFVVEVFDGEKRIGRMRVNQSWRVLEPASGYRAMILAPDFSGAVTEHEARIRPASDFQGWVITSPKLEEE